jgi:hypothetical protein
VHPNRLGLDEGENKKELPSISLLFFEKYFPVSFRTHQVSVSVNIKTNVDERKPVARVELKSAIKLGVRMQKREI